MIFLGNTNTVVDVRKGLEPIQKIMNGSTEIFNGIPTEQQYVYRQSAGNGVCYIRTLEGKSLVWNQKLRTSFTPRANCTLSIDGNVYSIKSTGDISMMEQACETQAGHSYYIRAYYKLNRATAISGSFYLGYLGPTQTIWTSPAISGETLRSGYSFSNIVKPSVSNARINLGAYHYGETDRFTEDDTLVVTNPILIDLTLLGIGNLTTVAEFEALYNEPYYPNQPGVIKNNDAVAMESVGFNQWDEDCELGIYNYTTGQPTPSTEAIRSKNYTPCLGGVSYYFKVPGTYSLRVLWYDADKNFISALSSGNYNNTALTAPANAAYLKIGLSSAYGTTYNHDICINLSDASRNGIYEPYWKKSIQLGLNAFRVTDGTNIITVNGLKSAGDVFDEIDPVRKKYIQRIGEVDLGTLNWDYNNAGFFYAPNSGAKQVASNTTLANILCGKYMTYTASEIYNNTYGNGVGQEDGANCRVRVRDSAYTDAATFKAAMSGVMLQFALATPVEYDLVDDIPNAIEVDENGTERAIFPAHIDGAPSAPFRCQSNYYLTPANVED